MKDSRQPSSSQRGPVESAQLDVAETVGRLMHFWGFKRPMGRIWTILYLSPRPLSAAKLGQTLSMSAGGISMALAELEKWGCTHRTWIPGDRRDYFVAESDIWKMVKRVIRQRELLLVEEFTETLQATDATLEKAEAESSNQGVEGQDEARDLSYKRERLTRLLKLSEVGANLLAGLVAGQAVDPCNFIQTGSSTPKTAPKDDAL